MGFQTQDLSDANAVAVDVSDATLQQLNNDVAELIIAIGGTDVAVSLPSFIQFLQGKDLKVYDAIGIDLPDPDVEANQTKHYGKTVAIHNGSLFILKREGVHGTAAIGDWTTYSNTDYLLVRVSDPSNVESNRGKWYYHLTERSFRQLKNLGTDVSPRWRWVNISLSEVITNALFIGRFPSEEEAENFITNYDNMKVYYAFWQSALRELQSGFTEHTDPSFAYHWINVFSGINVQHRVVEVASQSELDAVDFLVSLPIVKITTVFDTYKVDDILLYDISTEAWIKIAEADTQRSVVVSSVDNQMELNAIETDGRVALVKIGTAFATYSIHDVIVYDTVSDAWVVLIDASNIANSNTSGITGIRRTDVANQLALDALTISGVVAIAEITAVFSSYGIGDLLIYDTNDSAWEVLLDVSSLGGTATNLTEVQAQDRDDDTQGQVSGEILNAVIDDRLGVPFYRRLTPNAGNAIEIAGAETVTLELNSTTSDWREIPNASKLFALKAEDAINVRIRITATVSIDSLGAGTSTFRGGIFGQSAELHRFDLSSETQLDWEQEFTLPASGTVIEWEYAASGSQTITISDLTLEVFVEPIGADAFSEGIQRSNVATEIALNALETEDRIAIAKVTIAFEPYGLNDVLIYDTVADAWEVLVNASDYSISGLSSVQRSNVVSQIELDALTTSDRVAVAKVTAAFGSYEVKDILIYDREDSRWEILVDASDFPSTFTGLSDTPSSITEARYLRGNALGELEEIEAAPIGTDRVVLFADTSTRTESNATFFSITLSRAPVEGRLLDIEIFFDGIQLGSDADDELQNRYNTIIPLLLESDDFLSRPIHTSINDPTGSIPYKTSRDVQHLSSSAGFAHTTIYIAKGNDVGTSMRLGCSHWGSFGSFVVRVVEYAQNAPVTDGTETDLEEGTRTATSVQVRSSSGDPATLQQASDTFAGMMSAAHFAKVERLGVVTRSDVTSQTGLNNLITEDQVAVAKVTTAFGSYGINDVLLYDSESDAWEVLIDASDYVSSAISIQRSNVTSQAELDGLTTIGRVAIARVTTAFGSYEVDDVLIYDTLVSTWEILVDASNYREGITGVERTPVASEVELDALTTADRVAVALITTAFRAYAVNDVLIYDSEASSWEVFVDASNYQGRIQRSDVASQTELNALVTSDRVAIAKVTTAFGNYAVNDVLIYDIISSSWEVLVDTSDYTVSNAITSINAGAVDNQEELDDIATDNAIAFAVVTTAFGIHGLGDYLIFANGVWSNFINASDYIEYPDIQRSDVASQTELDALITDNRVAIAKVTTAFGSYGLNDVLIYDTVSDAWEVLFDASEEDATSRGQLIATSNALPTTTLVAGSISELEWTIESDVPSGFEHVNAASAHTLHIPKKKSEDDVNGLWIVGLEDGTEVAEAFIPWSGGGIQTYDIQGANSYHALTFTNNNQRLIVQYFHGNADEPYILITSSGISHVFDANTTLQLYLAINKGGKGEVGDPGDTHVPESTIADEGETLVVDADGDFELTDFADRTRIANQATSLLNSLHSNAYRGITLNRDLTGLTGFDIQIELISTATNINVRTFSPTFPIETWLALDDIDLSDEDENDNPVRSAIQLHVQRINNTATSSFGWADLGVHIGRVANVTVNGNTVSRMAFALISVNNASVQTINIWLIPRTGVTE